MTLKKLLHIRKTPVSCLGINMREQGAVHVKSSGRSLDGTN